jgi:hypothetical protein
LPGSLKWLREVLFHLRCVSKPTDAVENSRAASSNRAGTKYAENRIFRPHFYFGDSNHEIDFVLYLNGLPIVALELKHEVNQNVHDAVEQFTKRDHTKKIFQHPFLYLAADTSDVMAATDPRKEEKLPLAQHGAHQHTYQSRRVSGGVRLP